MNQKIKKAAFSLSAMMTGLFGGLVFWQKFCFWRAQKKVDVTLLEQYNVPLGFIAYTSVGRGRPLLLIHSMTCGTSHKEWDLVLHELAETYHVYAIDLPGFGASFMPDQPWTAYQYAQCIHDFLEHVIGRPACILASNGGADMALIASMLYPEKIKGLFLLSPEGFGKGFATNEETKKLHNLLLPISGTQQFLLGTTKSKIKEELEEAFFEIGRAHV